MSVIIEQATKLVSWVNARLAERTSWDGGVVIAVGVCALIASPFIMWVAIAGIVYGAFTILKQEG